MRAIALCLMLGFGATLFAGRYEPIYTGQVDLLEKRGKKEVERAIKEALIARRWRITEEKGRKITAVLFVRSHMAKIEVTYTKKKIKLAYLDSKNLAKMHRGKRLIHRNYNRWIRILEKDLRQKLM